MNYNLIKEQAKEKIKGNKWNIWWPLLVIGVLESVLENIFGATPKIDFTNFSSTIDLSYKMPPQAYAIISVITILFSIINAGYLKYIVNFTRTGKFNVDDIINTVKTRWLDILVASILTSVIIFLFSLLLVIPGIIMAFAYTLVIFLVIDKNYKGPDALKASKEAMKGHKWEYFVFNLSFLGWFILCALTCGILCIWVVPYYITANTMVLDELSKGIDPME